MGSLAQFARQAWVMFFLWFLVLVLVTGREARGERGVAGLEHFEAKDRANDCVVFRSLLRKNGDEIRDLRGRLENQIKISQDRRGAVIQCAREKGITSLDSIKESLGAEICADAYNDWLQISMQVRITREDLVDLAQGYQTLQLHTDYQCQPLPIPAVMPTAPPPQLIPLRDGKSASATLKIFQGRVKLASAPMPVRRTPRMPMND